MSVYACTSVTSHMQSFWVEILWDVSLQLLLCTSHSKFSFETISRRFIHLSIFVYDSCWSSLLPLFALMKRRHPFSQPNIYRIFYTKRKEKPESQRYKDARRWSIQWLDWHKWGDAEIFTRKQCNHHKVNLVKIEFTCTLQQSSVHTRYNFLSYTLNVIANVQFWCLFWLEQNKTQKNIQKIPEKNTLIKVNIRWCVMMARTISLSNMHKWHLMCLKCVPYNIWG